MPEKENQRVALTKRLLKEALLRLLQEYEPEKINVTQLCREAGINRATFYKHYAVPRDVLLEIEYDIVRQVRAMEPAVRTDESIKGYLTDICAYLYEHRALVKQLLRYNADEDLVRFFSDGNKKFWSRYHDYSRDLGLDDTDLKLMVTYFSTGGYYLIRQWLEEDLDKTPQQIAALIIRFLRH